MNRRPVGRLHGPRPASLRRRLLLWVSFATLLIYVFAAGMTYRQAMHEVQELMDGQMSKAAKLLLIHAQGDPTHLDRLANNMENIRGIRTRRSEMTLEFLIVKDGKTLLARSPNAPSLDAMKDLGLTSIEHQDQPWRTLVAESADRSIRVLVAQSVRKRNREALEIAVKTIQPLGLLLPLLIGLIYFSVRRGLQPLEAIAGEVSARSPENLAPLLPHESLQETQPLVEALNRLLQRLAATLENERRFTADAAHELRTPLAALKVHAQVALATHDEQQSRQAVAKVITAADRATRLVEQMLRLARLDPLSAIPDPVSISLDGLARRIVEDAEEAASYRHHVLRIDLPTDAVAVKGNEELLAAALRNLVDNAIKYTPEGSHISVAVRQENGLPLLEVRDDGPGVPAAELPRLVERFYRGRDVTSEGSGFGLAIVCRIAELHGARLEVENLPAGGFAARLRWYAGKAAATA